MEHDTGSFKMREIMRLGLDTRNTALAHGTGVARYAEMLGQIAPLIGFTPQWLTAEHPIGTLQRWSQALQVNQTLSNTFNAPDIFRIAQKHFDLYRRPLTLLAQNPPPLMHWTYPLPLLLKGSHNIVTIHDLIPLRKPSLSGINTRRMRRLLENLIRKVDGIVTVSETIRGELIAEFGLAPDRVQNLLQCVDVTSLDNGGATEICPPGSFVTIGKVEQRKNITRLIAAHAASGVKPPLVIIGPDGEGAAHEMAGAGGNVIRIPYAARNDLLLAIKHARAVLFPSLAEGFGLPIAEAFALGVPVMTSSGGATEEVAGGAALLVDPYDIKNMAHAIKMLARDDALCNRLKDAADIRARLFTPEAYAARVQDYYGTIIKRPLRFPN